MKYKGTGGISYFNVPEFSEVQKNISDEIVKNPFDHIDFSLYKRTQIKRKVLGYVSKPD